MTRPDFAHLIIRLKEHYDISESEIARRLGVSIATVNNWVHRRRITPRTVTLERIAEVFPSFNRSEIFAAAGQETPGLLTGDAKERVITLYVQLTLEQQRFIEIQMRALVKSNKEAR